MELSFPVLPKFKGTLWLWVLRVNRQKLRDRDRGQSSLFTVAGFVVLGCLVFLYQLVGRLPRSQAMAAGNGARGSGAERNSWGTQWRFQGSNCQPQGCFCQTEGRERQSLPSFS